MGENEYLAFSDEAYYTRYRFRGISVLSIPASSIDAARAKLLADLSSSEVSEFEWKNLASARERFAAQKLIDSIINLALVGDARVDTIVWDTHDSRHDIQGRDDIKNLERMYYQLFKVVLKYRGPRGAKWRLHPDENSAVDWTTLHEVLESSGTANRTQMPLRDQDMRTLISTRRFNVRRILEVSSSESPEVQVCDLFAGLGVYSHSNFKTYERWCVANSDQLSLPLPGLAEASKEFTRSERERCKVISYLNEKCKEKRLQVGLSTSAGFHTYNPRMPINFWPYVPQHPGDRAPLRDK